MKSDHPGHCFGVAGVDWEIGMQRKFSILKKESKHEVVNDIKHKPFENKTFSKAMSNPPTIRVFKCMYDKDICSSLFCQKIL